MTTIIATVLALLTAAAVYVLQFVVVTTAAMWVLFAVIHNLCAWGANKGDLIQWTTNRVFDVFQAIDVAYNLFVGSIWFLEWPKGQPIWFAETFSDRCRRHYRSVLVKGWRKDLAAIFRGPINIVDEGHI